MQYIAHHSLGHNLGILQIGLVVAFTVLFCLTVVLLAEWRNQ